MRIVGREVELGLLSHALDDAASGAGSAWLVLGEPGIGKTCLVEEVGARARARGFRVLWGRSWEAGGAPAYWPWIQALRSLAGYASAARSLAELLELAAAARRPQVPDRRRDRVDVPRPSRALPRAVRHRALRHAARDR